MVEGVQGRRSDLLSARALLDEALIGLRAIVDPEVRLVEARMYVEASLDRVYRALAHADEQNELREHCAAALQDARDALTVLSYSPSSDQAVFEDLRLVAQAIGQLSGTITRPDAELRLPRGDSRPPLRASIGEPALHDLQRTVLHPTVPLPEIESVMPPRVDSEAPPALVPPDVSSAADLDALAAWARTVEEPRASLPPPPPPPAPDPDTLAVEAAFGTAVAPAQIVWLRGRAWFEEIGMMSLMRQCGAAEAWWHLEQVEQRMLARVDAILACGPWILPRLVHLLEERPIPDPELTWAAIFVLGCIHGDDTRDQIERLLRITPLSDPELFDAVGDVLAFVPHRGIDGVLRRWLDDRHPDRSRLAIRALGRRGATSVETMSPHLRADDPARVLETIRAIETLPGELSPADLSLALFSSSSAVFGAAAECAIARGFSAGARESLERLRASAAPDERAALLTAITSEESADDLLLGVAATAPSPALYSALGWHGSTKSVPFLLGRLREGDTAAVLGLQRLTGASLVDGEDPPSYEDALRPFRRTTFVPPRFVVELSADPDLWAHWWKQHGARTEPHVRYRWGNRWTTRDNFYEMAEAIAAPADRRLAHLELCARTGSSLPFDPNAFVVRQRAQLEAWREYLGPSHQRAPKGAWPVRFRR